MPTPKLKQPKLNNALLLSVLKKNAPRTTKTRSCGKFYPTCFWGASLIEGRDYVVVVVVIVSVVVVVVVVALVVVVVVAVVVLAVVSVVVVVVVVGVAGVGYHDHYF